MVSTNSTVAALTHCIDCDQLGWLAAGRICQSTGVLFDLELVCYACNLENHQTDGRLLALLPDYFSFGACKLTVEFGGPLITKDAIDLIQNGLQTGENHLQPLIWLSVLLITVEFVMTLSKSLVGYLGELLEEKIETFLSVKFYQKNFEPGGWLF